MASHTLPKGNMPKRTILIRDIALNLKSKKQGFGNYQMNEQINSEGEIEELCPLTFEFLRCIICSDSNELYNYILNYLTVLLVTGRTDQALVCRKPLLQPPSP